MFHHLLSKLVRSEEGAILKDALVCALVPLIVIRVEMQHIDDVAERRRKHCSPCKSTFAQGKCMRDPLLCACCVFQVTVTKAETKCGNEKVTKKVTMQCEAMRNAGERLLQHRRKRGRKTKL